MTMDKRSREDFDPTIFSDAFNFTGGFPGPADLIPSIIFAVLFALSVPLFLWRCIVKKYRHLILVRPGLFLGLRLAMFTLRAVMSVRAYADDELRGENSLVSISFLILLLPLIDEWRLHLLFTVPKKDRAFWVTPLIWLLYMTIITSMIVSLVSSILIESRMPKFEITRRLWRSGYILATAVTVGTMAGVLATTKLYDLGRKQSTYIFVLLCGCLLTASYRIAQIFTLDETAPIRSKWAFYIFEGANDFVIMIALLAININEWFPGDRFRKAEEQEKANKGPVASEEVMCADCRSMA